MKNQIISYFTIKETMLYRKIWIMASLLMITSLARAQFTHPGILSSMDELNVVRNNQAAEPWKSALDALKASEPGSLSYSMRGPYSAVYRGSNNNEGWVQHGRDATACYVQALLGYITGNSTYTNNAISIINAWSNTLNSIGGNDVELLAGIQGPLWAQAGEILAHTNTGWASSDITRAKNMLTNIFLPPMDGFASADGANFSTTCMYATMAIAVFTDNQSKFDDTWNAFISTASCPNDFSLYKNIAENGQNVESGRDQVHSWSSYEMLSGLAEIAYHQGYAPYTLGSNRLKTGVEYWCKYNLGGSVPYDESVYRCRTGWGPWPEISDVNRGVPTGQGSVCNMVRRAYERLGQSTPYTSQMADAVGNTIVGATPRNGWGAPFIADALLSNTPGISISLTATSGDGTVSLNWTRNDITLGRQDVFRDTDSDMNGRTMIAGDIGDGTSYIDSTAQNSITYWYWIKATDTSGAIINSNSAKGTTPPVAPANFTATAGNTQAFLSWDSLSNASSYSVKRATASGGPYTTVGANLNETEYVDADLENGTTYYFVVTAANFAGKGANSDEVSATPQLAIPPEPVNPRAASISAQQIDLSWGESLTAETYNIKRATVSRGPYTVVDSVSTTAYSDQAVSEGDTYYYVISAINEKGESADSEEVIAAPGKIAYLNFDETEGSTAADVWTDMDGTLANGATWSEGIIDNGVLLNGAGDAYVEFPAGIMAGVNDFTISTWVKLDENPTWSRIFDFGSGTGTYMFLTPGSGSNTVRYAIKSGDGEQQLNSASALPVGEWHHVAVTLSGNTGILYIDGEEAGRNTNMTLSPSDLRHTTQNWIGRSQWPDPPLNGSVDEFKIFTRALSAEEVAEAMQLSPEVSIADVYALEPVSAIDPNTVYPGYEPAETLTLHAEAAEGIAPYTYAWNTGETTGTIDISAGGTYSVTVTDARGYKAETEISINEIDVRCGNKWIHKTLVCFKNRQLCVVPVAVSYLLDLGGRLGTCDTAASGSVDLTEDSIEEDHFMVYPNPAQSFIVISAKEQLKSDAVVRIFNNTGRLMFTEKISGNDQTISIGHLPKGIYVVKIAHENAVTTKKVIRN